MALSILSRAMSRENVEIVRIGYQRYLARGEFTDEIVTANFVWDMSLPRLARAAGVRRG